MLRWRYQFKKVTLLKQSWEKCYWLNNEPCIQFIKVQWFRLSRWVLYFSSRDQAIIPNANFGLRYDHSTGINLCDSLRLLQIICQFVGHNWDLPVTWEMRSYYRMFIHTGSETNEMYLKYLIGQIGHGALCQSISTGSLARGPCWSQAGPPRKGPA